MAGRLPCDRQEEITNLNGLQIVEAELMPGRHAEGTIRLVLRPSKDLAKATLPRLVRGQVQTKLVEALLAESDGTFRARDLEVVAHLPPGRDPAGLNDAAAAVGKAQVGSTDIFDFDRPPLLGPRSDRAGSDRRDRVPENLVDWANQIACRSDDVAAEVGQSTAAARRVEAPTPGAFGIHQVVFGVDAVERADFADLAAGDDLARELEEGVLQVVEPDGGGDPSAFRGEGHLERLAHRGRQWLLAVDMLAGGNGRKRHLLVEGVRRRDVDDADPFVGNELTPVAGRAIKPQHLGGTRGTLRIDIGQHRELGLDGEGEHMTDVEEAERVGLPHEPRADQTNSKTHAQSLFLLRCP